MDKIVSLVKNLFFQFTSLAKEIAGKITDESESVIRKSLVDSNNPYVRADSGVVQKRVRRAERLRVIRERYDKMSLKTAFAMYVSLFLLFALLLIFLTDTFLGQLHTNMINNYRYELELDLDSTEKSIIEYLTDFDITVNGILTSLRVLSVPVFLIICIILSGILFFRNRLEPPIAVLSDASQKIAEKDLDFTVEHLRGDEFGRLCDSFEGMRKTLLLNNNEMWRQMEERRRLNNAFSHDLRTPLTVLKGNAHMMREYLLQDSIDDDQIENSVITMQNHINRMENYVEAMNSLQRLEDIEVNRRKISSRVFTATLKNNASILCEKKALNFFDDIEPDTVFIDEEIVLRVAGNLLGNASRYAKSCISVVCSHSDNHLSISVLDDGDGFSETDLKLATNPFYKSKKNIYDAHFGLGLNISKILTERHGGDIMLSNVSTDGALVRATFSEK